MKMIERAHIKFGITEAEWVRRSINEARTDPIGVWQIVRVGRQGFGLNEPDLYDFVRKFIIEMIRAGAQPIIGDKESHSGWASVTDYGRGPEEIAESVLRDWKRAGVDPDVEGVWFAFPDVWRST